MDSHGKETRQDSGTTPTVKTAVVEDGYSKQIKILGNAVNEVGQRT